MTRRIKYFRASSRSRAERGGDAGEMVARPAPGIEHIPAAARRPEHGVLQPLDDFHSDEVEMAGVEKGAAVPQLRGTVAAGVR